MEKRLFTLPFIANLTLALLSIIMLGYLLILGKVILAPFFFALLLALLFLPFTKFLEAKLRFPRFISTFSAVLVLLSVLVGLSYFFGSQLSDFSRDIPHLEKQFSKVFFDLQKWVSETFDINADKQFEYLNQGLSKILSSSGVILGFTIGVFSSSLAFLFFCSLFFIFILNYRRVLYRFIVSVFKDKHKGKVEEIVNQIQRMTKSYIIGICIQIVIVSLLTTSMLLFIDVKYAILLGVLTGILNVIPYIGILFSMIVSSFIAFATGTPISTLYVMIGYVVVHAIDGNLVLPFVVGSKVKINALFSFLGILIGEQLWGISGMFLCIPALAIIKIIFDRVDALQPWGALLGEEPKVKSKKRRVVISKNITLEEKD